MIFALVSAFVEDSASLSQKLLQSDSAEAFYPVCRIVKCEPLPTEVKLPCSVSYRFGKVVQIFSAMLKAVEAAKFGGLMVHCRVSCLHPVLIDGGVTNITTTRPLSVKTMRVKEVVNG